MDFRDKFQNFLWWFVVKFPFLRFFPWKNDYYYCFGVGNKKRKGKKGENKRIILD